MDILAVLHDWIPILWPILTCVVGWLAKSVSSYRKKDKEDHKALCKLADQVSEMRADLDAIKAGNIAEYQESISSSHVRYCTNHTPLTFASRGRINAMMRSLSALDDEDGTYQRLVDEINALPIWQPEEHAPKEDQ